MITVLPKDARLWSFWGHGWLCVPVTPGWTADGRGIVCGRLCHELERQVPGLLTDYGRFSKVDRICVVYAVTRLDGKWRARFHDPRLPSSNANTGVVLVPTRTLDTDSPGESWKTHPSWDNVRFALTDLKDRIRPALHGNIYLPVLGLCDDTDTDELVEGISEELNDKHGFVLLTGENDVMIPPRSSQPNVPHKPSTSDIIQTPQPTSSIAGDFDTLPVRR